MKKLFAIVFCILYVVSFGGCEQTPRNTQTEINTETIIGYIKGWQNETVLFDEIEWVTVPGERATELGITDDDASNGFYIHNEEDVTIEYDIADKCVICILDWENNFVTKQIEFVEFINTLEQRAGAFIPYMLTVEEGKIITIQEHYIP